MADTKQTLLVEAISNGAHAKLAPEIKSLAESIAKLVVTCGGIQARLEMLEAVGAPRSVEVKRTVRTGTAASTSAKKPAKKGSATGLPGNSLLYFREQMGKNVGNVRAVYCTEENLAEALKDPSVAKQDCGRNEHGYYSSIAAFLWKNRYVTPEQKAEWKRSLELLSAEAKVLEREPQLEEEVAEDE